MTQVDVLKMAIEAGLAAETSDGHHQIWYPDNLYHFAKLVEQEVRDKIMFGSRDDWVLAEREACAQLAEEWLGPSKDREIHIAKAIRARGEQA